MYSLQPLISIIIATHNAAEDLRYTLESLKQYGDSAIEVIVQDACSADKSCAVAHEYIPMLLAGQVCSEKDTGIYDAWNKALRLAHGEWILFMGAGDSILSAQVLHEISIELQKLPISCDYYSVPVQSVLSFDEPLEMIYPSQSPLKELQHGMCLPHQGLFHRRRLFEQQDFSTKYRIAGDYDFVCRTLKADNWQLGSSPCVRMLFGGLSSSMLSMLQREKEFWNISRQYYPQSFSWKILLRALRVKLYTGILSFGGKQAADIFADLPRRLKGKPALWTKDITTSKALLPLPEEPAIDLLVATIKRKEELIRLLESLRKQTYKKFRILIADQNSHGFLDDSLAAFNDLTIVRIELPFTGVSEARNALLPYCAADIVAFPDDDCWYEENTLAQIVALFSEDKNCAGIIACHAEKYNKPRCSRTSTVSSQEQCFFQSETYLQYYRDELVKNVGKFDPLLGPGTGLPYGCGEDSDYLVRAYKAGYHIKRVCSVQIHHPLPDFHTVAYDKVSAYAAGRMYLLKKYQMSVCFILANIFFPLLKLPYDTIKYGKQGFLYRWTMFIERLKNY
jgi:glycosyltransferase involved in cell wall biosynthesis